MLKNALLSILTASVLMLAGCNTMAGFGKDVSKVGNKIEKKAEQVQK